MSGDSVEGGYISSSIMHDPKNWVLQSAEGSPECQFGGSPQAENFKGDLVADPHLCHV